MDIDSLLESKRGIRLDIACGEAKQGPEWVGIDVRPLAGVDIVHDLLTLPWPLPDECVLMALASHFLEHVPGCAIDNGHVRWPFLELRDEAWRVMKVGGEFAIAVPHGTSPGYMQDPTHCNAMNEARWAYFDPLEPNTGGALWRIYKPKPWRIKFLTWDPFANMEVILVKRHLTDWQKEAVNYE